MSYQPTSIEIIRVPFETIVTVYLASEPGVVKQGSIRISDWLATHYAGDWEEYVWIELSKYAIDNDIDVMALQRIFEDEMDE